MSRPVLSRYRNLFTGWDVRRLPVAHKLLFLVPEDHYFWSHRRPIATAARESGYEIVVATLVNKHAELIRKEGFKLIPLKKLKRGSRNPFNELLFFMELSKIFRRERPAIVHQVTVKPVLCGSWAARWTGVPVVVNALAGLGYIFIAPGRTASMLKKAVMLAYKSALSLKNSVLIFQNPDDQKLFVDSKVIPAGRTVLIRGAGVDTARYPFVPEPAGVPVVLLASRLLWDKGVGELVEAIRLLKSREVICRAVLVGEPDPGNPASIPQATLLQWQLEGILEWWGRRDDMPEVLARANLVVLPSYREGLPKVLLEAASTGRAIVTTDTPGCREIVKHRENGLLIPVKDPVALANAIDRLLSDPGLRSQMGLKGRGMVEKEFSEARVVGETLALYDRLLCKIGAERWVKKGK